MESRLAKIRNKARQAGQGMTEYLIIVAVIAIASIATYTYFGDTLRHQTAAAAKTLAGQDGSSETTAANTQADQAIANATRRLENFAEDRN
jgi:Flp pilus assembly pilin Flp